MGKPFLDAHSRMHEPLSTIIDSVCKRMDIGGAILFCHISFSKRVSVNPYMGLFSNFLLQMRLKKITLMKQLSYDGNVAASNQVQTMGRLP